MSKLKLTYFDFNGGRAEAARMALAIGGVDFEDERISFAQFGEMRESFPLKAVPTMEIDGVTYAQSNAMTRYAGRLTGLYPDDAWDAFLCDEILETAEDATVALVKSFGLEGDALKAAREKFVDDSLTLTLQLFDRRLKAAGGEYFVANKLTVADLKVFVWIRALQSGMLDHVPTDLADKVAPKLVEHTHRVASHPAVDKYLSAIA